MKIWMKRTIQITYIILVTWFSVGSRILPTPIGLFTVSGFSMYPSLKPGDLVIGVPSSLNDLSTGDIVIYCREAFACIVHRLLLVNSTIAITKGDYNPSVDPPVPVELIRFKVMGSIPLLVWLPVAVLSIILLFFPVKPWKGLRQAFIVEIFMFLALLMLNLSFLTIYVIQTPPFPTRLSLPDITLARLSTKTDSAGIIIDYASTGLKIVSIEECVLMAKNISSPCSRYHVENNRIIIQPSDEFYAKLLNSNLSAFIAQITVKLDKGLLLGKYPVVVEWRHPVLTIDRDKLIVYNPNPAPIEVSGLRLRKISTTGFEIYSFRVQEDKLPGFILNPFETKEISIAKTIGEVTYLEVNYIFSGQVFTWVGKIEG